MERTAYVRPYRPTDREALAEICVRTADNGGDSTHLYPDPGLMPALFAEPYAHLAPELTFVLDDGSGRAVGYVLGTADTKRFVDDFRAIWLPRVTDRFPEPEGEPETPTEAMTALLHRPERMILAELEGHPAHLHIDLLPPWQRKGHGRRLMGAFLDALHRQWRPGRPPVDADGEHPRPGLLRPARIPRDRRVRPRAAHLSGALDQGCGTGGLGR